MSFFSLKLYFFFVIKVQINYIPQQFICLHDYIDRVSDKSIGQFLRYAFTSRYKEILSKSHSSSTTTVPKFAPRLTKEEARGTTDFSLPHALTRLLTIPFVSLPLLGLSHLLCAVKCLIPPGNRWPLSRNGVSGARGCRRRPSLAGRGRRSFLMGPLRPEPTVLCRWKWIARAVVRIWYCQE